jgi:predicted nucleic acid-binding protein
MMLAVTDSGPFMYLAMLHHADLLPHYFQPLLTPPQVYDEVATQGSGRPGAHELTTMCERSEVRLVEINEPRLIEQRSTLLTDDNVVRMLAMAQNVPVIGSIGVLIRARLDGIVPALKPLLDQLIAAGFHLDPQGHAYREALQRVGED